MEETGVTDITPVQVKAFGSPERDPRTTIITTLFTAMVKEDLICPKAGDDAADAAFFDIEVKEENDLIFLTLENKEKDLKLSAKLKKHRTQSGVLSSEYFELLGSDRIAMDHAILIIEAFRFINR